MKYLKSMLVVIMIVGLAFAIPTMAAEKAKTARQELDRLGVVYSEEAFFKQCYRGDTEIISLFLKAGISPDANNGRPLNRASAGRNLEVMRLLMEAGADPDATNKSKITNLMYAAMNVRPEVARVLLDGGADPNARCAGGNPPLWYLWENGNIEIAQLLLDAGADPNAKNNLGRTLLMTAVGYGHSPLVKLLLEYGADPNAENFLGKTAMLSAIGKGHDEIAELLLKAGAKPINMPSIGKDIEFEKYIGKYRGKLPVLLLPFKSGMSLYMEFVITLEDDKLMIKSECAIVDLYNPKEELIPVSETMFYRKGTEFLVVFNMNKSGNVENFTTSDAMDVSKIVANKIE